MKCKCGQDKFVYPEGSYCPECEKTEISQLGKKYFEQQMKKIKKMTEEA